jgi:hypothetical protein
MAWSIASGVITQTGTDTSLAGLVGLAGVTVNTSPNGMRFYSVDATITLIVITGTLSWDSDYECLVLSDATRVEQNAGAVVTIGAVTTVNGKTRYSRGTGLVMNRFTNLAPNTSAATWWMKSAASLALGSKLVVNGGQLKYGGSIFLGTTTTPVGQFATIELNGKAELCNIAGIQIHMIRSFCQPNGKLINDAILSGRTQPTALFSSLGYQKLAAEIDFAALQCDGNGPKPGVTVENAVFAKNKADRDYSYVAAASLIANINKYIFANSDVGSALRTLGAFPLAWRQGVVELTRDVSLSLAELSGTPVAGAVTYMRLNGASINPSGRFAGIDDYMTPRVYIRTSDAGGATAASTVLFAVAQGYETTSANQGQPLTMDSLTSSANDVHRAFVWSYGHTLAQPSVPMRGNGTALVPWTMFADPSITLNETAARAKLASSFTLNATTKVITVTANSSYQDLYDALKAYKSTANIVNLEATPIDELLVKPDGVRLVGYTGWTLAVNSGVTLTAGGKYTSLYFDTVTVNGAIAGTYADSTGTRVTIRERTDKLLSTYVTINSTPVGGTVVDGTLRAGWVPLSAARVITVQPADAVRIAASYYGSKPTVFNMLGSEVDKFVLSLDLEPAIDTNTNVTIRDEITACFSTVTNGATLEVTINKTLKAYTPKQVLAGLDYYIVSRGFLLHGAIAQSNNASLYAMSEGTIVTYSPAYKIRMSDLDALGNPIVPTTIGYEAPLVIYYEDLATGIKSTMTLLNASGAFLGTAPWTQQQASIGDADKQAIADISAVEVWTAPTRTLTSGGGGGSGATAQEVWEYATRTLTAGVPTAAQNASAVRTELATELSRVDVTTSTRLAAAGYTAPPTVSAITADIERTGGMLDGKASQASVNALPAPLNATQTQAAAAAALVAYDAVVPADLAGLATAASVTALAAATGTPMQAGTVVAANIVQVNSVTVDGTGSEGDEWGPAP